MTIQAERMLDYCDIVTEPIDLNELACRVRTDASGAVAIFTGTVRNHHDGKLVDSLDYEAYGPMAEKQMRRICAEMRDRWGLEGVAMVHRTGHLKVGETSVAVAVSAAHRKEALEACTYAIERLKESVPIWKREHGEAGLGWVVGTPSLRGPIAPFLPLGGPSARRRVKAEN